MRVKDIPQELIDKYMNFELTSKQMGELTGLHPVTIRKSFTKPSRPSVKAKKELIQARRQFRLSLGGLPLKEIMETAHVSLSTASRIKKEYKNDRKS